MWRWKTCPEIEEIRYRKSLQYQMVLIDSPSPFPAVVVMRTSTYGMALHRHFVNSTAGPTETATVKPALREPLRLERITSCLLDTLILQA